MRICLLLLRALLVLLVFIMPCMAMAEEARQNPPDPASAEEAGALKEEGPGRIFKVKVLTPEAKTGDHPVEDRGPALVEDPTHAETSQEMTLVLWEEFQQLVEASTLLEILLAILATVALALILKWLLRLFNFLRERMPVWGGVHLRSVRYRNLELISAERLTVLLVRVLKVVQILLAIFLLYWYATLVFSLFPATQGIARTLIDYVVSFAGFVLGSVLGFLPNALSIGIILVLSFYALRFFRFIALQLGNGNLRLRGFHQQWALPTYKIVRFLVIVFALIMIFPYLPLFDTPAFKGISVFLGVLFSLGSTSAIANIVAGVVLVYMRPFKVGDYVKIGENTGSVVEMSLLVTRLRTNKNEEITVPNAMTLGGPMTNYSSVAKTQGLILHTTITIGYDIPWHQVQELLLAAARQTEGVLEKPEPFVLQKKLDDFYVAYELNVGTDQPARMSRIYSSLHQNILDVFNEAGVEIMSPHYSALRDGNTVTLPVNNLPGGYQPPPFRVAHT